MSIDGIQHAICIGSVVTGCVAIYSVYLVRSRKQWLVILNHAFRYHSDNITIITNEGDLSNRSRDAVRILTWILKKQMPEDVKRGLVGFRGLFYSQSAVQTAWNAFFDLSGNSHGLDQRLLRLLNTLISTLYSYYLLHSIFLWVTIPVLDVRLMFSRAGTGKAGAMALFRDIGHELKTIIPESE